MTDATEPLSMSDRAKADAHKSLLERAKRAEAREDELLARANLGDLRTAELAAVIAALHEAGIDTDDPAAGVRELAAQRGQLAARAREACDHLSAAQATSTGGGIYREDSDIAAAIALLCATPSAPPEEPGMLRCTLADGHGGQHRYRHGAPVVGAPRCTQEVTPESLAAAPPEEPAP
jgi:hypothetical protein